MNLQIQCEMHLIALYSGVTHFVEAGEVTPILCQGSDRGKQQSREQRSSARPRKTHRPHNSSLKLRFFPLE
jgi:hypothetical protein